MVEMAIKIKNGLRLGAVAGGFLLVCLAGQASLQASAQASAFAGSVTAGPATGDTLALTLDEAIERGLKNNLGVILTGTQKSALRGQKLEELQPLLPKIDANVNEALMQTDLAAEGLRIPGFPSVIGPFGYTDLRVNLNWTLLNLASMKHYMAAKHNFQAAEFTVQDAREMVVLAVGNAYLLAVADEARVESVQAELKVAEGALHDAKASHEAGTSPKLDELRARVDFQREQQLLIAAQNALEKDKLALARTIGLPLEQKFTLADQTAFTGLDALNVDTVNLDAVSQEPETAIARAKENRADRAALAEQTKAGEDEHKAAFDDRLPTIKAEADYGDIGVNVRHSHGTGDAVGTLSIPVFKEAQFHGESLFSGAQLDALKAELSDKNAQIDADVREALLDLKAARKQVEVARSNVDLAAEALSEARLIYTSGVSDNLGVTDALAAYAGANAQLVASQYQYNMARLSLARALGDTKNYKQYLGGK
jgi:outer membrane protein TolC